MRRHHALIAKKESMITWSVEGVSVSTCSLKPGMQPDDGLRSYLVAKRIENGTPLQRTHNLLTDHIQIICG